MPVPIGRGEVQALMADGALLLDVLDPTDFAWAHLPGARNVPAAGLIPERLTAVDRAQAIVVYSADLQCDLSPRSARLLERYGFHSVFDYEAGKADWLAYGLPYQGEAPHLLGGLLEPCLCTAGDETVEELRARMDAAGFDQAVVVDAVDVVLGMVTRVALESAPADTLVVEEMVPTPLTFRPTTHAHELARHLVGRNAAEALVTTPSGRLLGRVTAARLRGQAPSPGARTLVRAGMLMPAATPA